MIVFFSGNTFLMNFHISQILRSGFWGLLLTLITGPLAQATTVIPPEFEELATRSDYVVRGRVVATNAEIRIKGSGKKIFTRVEVEVLEVIQGTPPVQLILECLGGRVGDEELIVGGAPSFVVGEESILFVSGNGRALCPLYAMSYGFYPIKDEGATKRRYVARGNQVPLENVAEIAQPLLEGDAAEAQRRGKRAALALSPDDFAQKIKSVVRAKSTRATNN